MTTMSAEYLGDLRVQCQHDSSKTMLITDAPLDNQGKGESFSPTDLVATALGACAMTIMGITGKAHNIPLEGTKIEITKIMNPEPRRIGEIKVIITMPKHEYSDKQRIMLERSVKTCPVHLSLHPEVKQSFVFNW